MKLIADDYVQVYYWIDEETDKILSPHFDYEDDATQWFLTVYKKMAEVSGIKFPDISGEK